MAWLGVAIGGALGSMLRYLLGLIALSLGGTGWAWGTLAANVIGSFGLGLVFVAGDGRQLLGMDARLLLGTGAMGGFTTYSTFNLDIIQHAQQGQWGRAVAYAALTLVTCLGAGLLGLAAGRAITS